MKKSLKHANGDECIKSENDYIPFLRALNRGKRRRLIHLVGVKQREK